MTAAIVLPVQDGAELLPAALPALVAAADAVGGTVVVVDDGSTDDTAAVAARLGATVERLDEAAGPYVARNRGWQATNHEVAVFVDARCRPRDGWLPRLLAALDRPGAALAAGDVVVLPAPHLAGRVAHRLQPLAAANGRNADFLPYAPTCHLAVPRSILAAEGGFRAVRGGGDVDLCWRVQLAGHGTLEWADDAVLDWEPRTEVRGLLEQYQRYGHNARRLHRAYAARGCPTPPATHPARLALHAARTVAAGAVRSSPKRWPEETIAAAANLVYGIGYWRGDREPIDERLG